jgi:quercetin dioxygenase-like cupin family protein
MAYQIKNILDIMEMPKHGILSTPVEDNEYYKVVLFMMPTGQYISPHTSTMAATIYVIKGKADFTLGDETSEVKAGDHFFMPPNFNHAVNAKEDFVFLLHLRK